MLKTFRFVRYMFYSLYVDGICTKDGKILLVKRNCEPFKGFWHFVGGRVHKHESLEAALKREFKEETNLDVQVGEAIGWRIEQSFDRTKIIVALKIVGNKGKVKLNCENEEYGWFSKIPVPSIYDYSKYLNAHA